MLGQALLQQQRCIVSSLLPVYIYTHTCIHTYIHTPSSLWQLQSGNIGKLGLKIVDAQNCWCSKLQCRHRVFFGDQNFPLKMDFALEIAKFKKSWILHSQYRYLDWLLIFLWRFLFFLEPWMLSAIARCRLSVIGYDVDGCWWLVVVVGCWALSW